MSRGKRRRVLADMALPEAQRGTRKRTAGKHRKKSLFTGKRTHRDKYA